ncbi:MAG: SMP-30/gluconolactonase/LRE family protein [Candidatus Aminicenantales bacterium]
MNRARRARSIGLPLAALAALLLSGACRKSSQPAEGLFIVSPLTAEGQFTAGIEGPACDAAGNVYAAGYARQGTIGRVSPDGRAELFAGLPEGSVGNGIRVGPTGALFVADYTGHNILVVDPATRFVRVFAHEPAMNQPNDLALSPDGVLYASDPNWQAGTGQIWRIDARGRMTRAAADMGTTNGIEVSPDGRTLYVNESAQRKIWAFAILPDGGLADKRLVASFQDFGLDGMRCDADGNLYVTRHGKGTVVKLSPKGRILREIDVLGSKPSNLCFGGQDGRTVYVTEVEHTRLVRFRVDRPGREWGKPSRTPQFVCVSSDDNGYSGLAGSPHEGGLHYFTELFAGLRNPAGSGDARICDGASPHYTFFVNTRFIVPGVPNPHSGGYGVGDDPVLVKRAWREAFERGHEIAVHTHSHPHGRPFTVAQWEDEMRRSIEILTHPYDPAETSEKPDPSTGLGIPRPALIGFRAPFIEPADNGMTAAVRMGLTYDSSIEEGPGLGPHPGDFPWPYTLDVGIPAQNPPIAPHPGFWEIPLGNFVAPPDGACERYGVPAGFRAALAKRQDYFRAENGEITGMDWNLWNEYAMTPAEFLATLKYTLDLHLDGNRSPMTIGFHSELYTIRRDGKTAPDLIRARRAAVEAFLAYALAKPEVRLVDHRELLEWLAHPVSLRRE